MNDIKVGCARWYGVLYPSTSVPQGDYEKNNIIYNNVEDSENLYVGSVWKEGNDVHLSVTNDTNSEKNLKVELSNGEVKEFKIKACPSGKTWWNKGGAVQESYDKYTYDDMPFDIDISVGNTQWIKCYDGNELIRTQSFENEKEPEPDAKPVTATVTYSTTEQTNKDVIVTIKASEEIQNVEGWKLSTDKMTLTKTYTENTSVDGENIIIKDLAGNSTVVNVKVTSIDESEPTFTLNKYKIKNNCIIKIKPNTDYNTFIRDISTNRDYEVKDGNRILSGTDMIKTGQKLINGLGQTYTLVVTGDLNGDGKISLVELARISKIGAGKITSMTEIEKMVIDVNGDEKINIIDMAAISKEYKAQK